MTSLAVLGLLQVPTVDAAGPARKARTHAASRAPRPAPVKVPEPILEPRPLPPPTTPLSVETGWRLTYVTGQVQRTSQARDRLLEAVRTRSAEVGVMLNSFHGRISGPCHSVGLGADQEVECAVQVWCDAASEEPIPARHAHKVLLRSSGEVSYEIVTLNDRGEEKVLAFGDSDAQIAWYLK